MRKIALVCAMLVSAGILVVPTFLALSNLAKASEIRPEPVEDSEWYAHHANLVAQTHGRPISVLFLGDSITDYWFGDGAQVWRDQLDPLQAANFGIGGDRIEHVLWRIQNGETDGISPRAIVLLIGTNNLSYYSPEEISRGHALLVSELRHRLPLSKILLLAVFPRVDAWSDTFRDKIGPVNESLRQIAQSDTAAITYLDLGASFKDARGGISTEIMYDGLHLSEVGYRIWADGMMPVLKGLLGGVSR